MICTQILTNIMGTPCGSFWDEGFDIIIVNNSFSSDLLGELGSYITDKFKADGMMGQTNEQNNRLEQLI